MAISTTAFGVYFFLIKTKSKHHSTTYLSLMMLEASEEPQADLAWLALASMAVFISGEILEFSQTIYY